MTSRSEAVTVLSQSLAADWAAEFEAGADTISIRQAVAVEHASDELYAQHEEDLVTAFAAVLAATGILLDEHGIPTAVRTRLGGWMLTREEPRDHWIVQAERTIGGPRTTDRE